MIHGGWNSLRVGLVAVSISMLTGVLLGLLAGFYEGMEITPVERIFLQGLVGLALGSVIAWIAAQWVMAILFGVLGALSIVYEKFLTGKPARVAAFTLAGLLIGGGTGFLVSPMVALVCGLLGALLGGVLATPLTGKFFSNVVMRAMDIILAFPSYLLAIAIVAFLGPGFRKG